MKTILTIIFCVLFIPTVLGADKYWVGGGSSTNWHATGDTNWSLSSGGAGNEATPSSSEAAIFDGNSPTDARIDGNTTVGSINTTGYSEAIIHDIGYRLYVYGSITFGANTYSPGGSAGAGLKMLGSGNLTLGGNSVRGISLGDTGTTINLLDALTSVYGIGLTEGTFDVNDVNITCIGFGSDNANTRTINMGSGTWTLTGTSGNVWDTGDTTNLTLNEETSTIVISGVGGTFEGGGETFNDITLSTGAGIVTFTGSNTFNVFTITKPKTVKFTAATTTTVSSFVATGDSGDGITITSATSAAHILSDSAGTNAVEYCDISYSEAGGGATWNALTSDGNTDSGNNTGWIFTIVAAAETTIYNAELYNAVIY